MKILVTGGAGFIGHHVTGKLLERGHQVTVLDNLSYGSAGIELYINNPNLRFYRGDIGDLTMLCKSIPGQDAVIALAAIVGDPACGLNPDETIRSNYLSTKALVDVCSHYGVRKIVFASSCSVYGDTKDGIADESFILNPLSLYAETRIMSEQVLLKNLDDIDPVILRLATVFGVSERMRFDLVVNTLSAFGYFNKKITIHGTGDQWRPNVHVQDVAEAFIKAAELPSDQLKGQIINVGDESNTLTINQLGQYVVEALPNIEINHQDKLIDARNYRISFEKLRNKLGIKAHRSVRQGISELVGFFENNSNLQFLDDIYHNVHFLKRSMMETQESICVIVPIFNQANLISEFVKNIERLCLLEPVNISVVFIDDGSSDRSCEEISKQKQRSQIPIKLIELLPHRSTDSAIHAGIRNAFVAEYYALFNVELSYPTTLILDMVKHAKSNNNDLVYGIRSDIRIGNGFIHHLYSYLLIFLSSIPMPKDQSMIRVFNRKFLEKFIKRTDNPEFIPASFGRLKANIGYFPVSSISRSKEPFIKWINIRLNYVTLGLKSLVIKTNPNPPYHLKRIGN